jgi:hypothetical protein
MDTQTQRRPAQEQQPVHMNCFEQFMHWFANYVAIGWILNAKASVYVYHKVADRLDSPKYASDSKPARFGRFLKENPPPGSARSVKSLGKESLRIAALGTGGFTVLPLQDLYARNQVRISNAVRRVIGARPLTQKEPEEKGHANEGRWAVARVVSFLSGIAGFVIFKHGFSSQFKKIGGWSEQAAKGNIPAVSRLLKNVEHKDSYIAEQIAAGCAVITLWASKKLLDKHAHCHHRQEEGQGFAAREGAQPPSHRERAASREFAASMGR